MKTELLPVVVNGSAYEIRFYRSGSEAWSQATAKHPPREGVALDFRNGYNLTAVTREIAPESGRLVDGGDEQSLTAEQWADLWAVMPPATARLIEANVWHMHEYDTEQEILRAKKASRPARGSRKKSS